MGRNVLYTVGHSTRSLAELLRILREHGVRRVVDVRRFPTSRRHPHFRREALEAALAGEGIAYRHAPEMGGRRSPRPGSPNTAWRTGGFRGYADHMATEEFRTALARLEAEARGEPTAILCAEARPWRCHRQLIADALQVRGWAVVHLLAPGRAEPHRLNPNARRLPDGTLVYPAPPPEQTTLLSETESGGDGTPDGTR